MYLKTPDKKDNQQLCAQTSMEFLFLFSLLCRAMWLFNASAYQPNSTFLHVKIRLDRFILLPSGSEKPQFLTFFGLRHLVMSTVGGNLRKFNTDAQLQTFPYPTASKSFLYSNAFMAKSGEQTLNVQKRDVQTNRDGQEKRDRQTKNSTFFTTPAAGEIRALPNLAWW